MVVAGLPRSLAPPQTAAQAGAAQEDSNAEPSSGAQPTGKESGAKSEEPARPKRRKMSVMEIMRAAREKENRALLHAENGEEASCASAFFCGASTRA